MSKQKTLTKQMVEDIGEYHVCFELSRMGFRAVRTSKNAMGVDILAYSEKTMRSVTIQVKTNQEPSFADVCPRIDSSLSHGQADQDRNITVARFWVFVELDPKTPGKVKNIHVWDSEDDEDKRLLRAHGEKSESPTWALNTDLKSQRKAWPRRKGKKGWTRIVKFLNEAGK